MSKIISTGGLVTIALSLAACNTPPADAPSLGTLERDRLEISADSNQPILARLVREGDRVAAGDPLIQQDASLIDTQLDRARAELARAEAQLAEAESGPRAEAIAQARAQLAAAKSAEQTALSELKRNRELLERKLVSDNTVDLLSGRHEEAMANRQAAAEALAELRAGTRAEEIDQARSQAEAARAAVAELAIDRARTVVRAPAAGVIEALPFQVGERPPAGAAVAVIAADGRQYARVHVPQPLRSRLNPGAQAQIRVDGYDDPFEGELRWIATEANFTPFFALTRYDRSRLSFPGRGRPARSGPGQAAFRRRGRSGLPVEPPWPTISPSRPIS
jgi:HlyD family secretion protein